MPCVFQSLLRLDQERIDYLPTPVSKSNVFFCMAMLKILSSTISEPDEDGDSKPYVALEFHNESNRVLELLLCKTLIFTGDGLLALSDSDDNEDFIEPGESWKNNLHVRYIKASKIGGKSPKIIVELLGCSCIFHELGSFELSSNELVGIGKRVELGDGISIASLAVSVSKPDDNDDVTVEVQALIDNENSSHFPKAILSAKLMRSGREIEEITNYSDSIPPCQYTVLESSCNLKKRQLSGTTIDIRLSLFPIVTREVAESALI